MCERSFSCAASRFQPAVASWSNFLQKSKMMSNVTQIAPTCPRIHVCIKKKSQAYKVALPDHVRALLRVRGLALPPGSRLALAPAPHSTQSLTPSTRSTQSCLKHPHLSACNHPSPPPPLADCTPLPPPATTIYAARQPRAETTILPPARAGINVQVSTLFQTPGSCLALKPA